jgi:hypothetical protein
MASWAGCAAGSTETASTAGHTGGEGGSTNPTNTGGSTSSGNTGAGGSAGCAADQKLCNGACVKIDDPAYGCGQTSCDPCQSLPHATSMCSSGVCVFDSCENGFKNCDGADNNGCEANVQSDPTQCGACGSPCVVPHATPNCVNGVCGVGTCEAGYIDCDGDSTNGCEAQLQVDPKNCGTCGQGCAPGEGCQNGKCGVFCAKGKANCDGDATNGCETPLGTLTDCGFCGDGCDLANAQTSCDNGVCTLVQCKPGFANCNTNQPNGAADGCEINTNTDAGNCGFCGNVCPSGPHSTAVCQNGGCKLNCDPGYADCDGNPNNGCEVHTDVDKDNCGTCGHGCVVANGTAACTSGVCSIAQCNNGYDDCDKNPANGCEININTNPNNCGTCNAPCSFPNANPICIGGMCGIGSCGAGWGDCDNTLSTGCETNTNTSTNNCGTCGHACTLPNANPACTNGACTIQSCKAGFADCDHAPDSGCEIDTDNDPKNCGGCGKECFVLNGTAGCSMGKCTVASCNAGWGDCDGQAGNGCETDLNNSLSNCGTCGNNCLSTCGGPTVLAQQCSAGACQINACVPGKYNIDGACSNGCECTSTGTSGACNAPSSLGTLQLLQSTTYTGNLVPAGQEAYLQVTFASNASASYHPHIVMTSGSAEFGMDILVNCSGAAISCGVQGGNSIGRTDWEERYTAGDPNNPAQFNPIPPVGSNGTVIIHVFRRPGKPVSCNNYTLQISN